MVVSDCDAGLLREALPILDCDALCLIFDEADCRA
jgi:hypothetical protein